MKSFLVFVLCCLIAACNNQSPQSPDEPVSGKQSVFPVTSFLTSQIQLVDSLQLPVHKFVTSNKQTDSVLISLNEFKALAGEFLQPDFNDPSISQYYKESSFADQSLPSVTLNYAAQKHDLEIRRVDVNINPDPVLNDRVKSIYLEKEITRNDTLIHKKLYWRADRNFQVITTRQVRDQPPTVSVVKCIWDYSN